MPQHAKHSEDLPLPVLYSFRRCPYAIRARMAIAYSEISVELRDILLNDKPKDMVSASPKATVPVLRLPDEQVIDESLDVMLWAVMQNDPENWMPDSDEMRTAIMALIEENDGPFKSSLDHYKYHVRFPERTQKEYRHEGEVFLGKLEKRLSDHRYLFSNEVSLADMAIFPFIRQFSNTDIEWFENAPYPNLQCWLKEILSSRRFSQVMKKRPIWAIGTRGELFPVRDES